MGRSAVPIQRRSARVAGRARPPSGPGWPGEHGHHGAGVPVTSAAPAEFFRNPIGLADLGHEGSAGVLHAPAEKARAEKPGPAGARPIHDIGGIGERAGAPFVVRSEALRRVGRDPADSERSPPWPAYSSSVRTTAPAEDHAEPPDVTEKGSLAAMPLATRRMSVDAK